MLFLCLEPPSPTSAPGYLRLVLQLSSSGVPSTRKPSLIAQVGNSQLFYSSVDGTALGYVSHHYTLRSFREQQFSSISGHQSKLSLNLLQEPLLSILFFSSSPPPMSSAQDSQSILLFIVCSALKTKSNKRRHTVKGKLLSGCGTHGSQRVHALHSPLPPTPHTTATCVARLSPGMLPTSLILPGYPWFLPSSPFPHCSGSAKASVFWGNFCFCPTPSRKLSQQDESLSPFLIIWHLLI